MRHVKRSRLLGLFLCVCITACDAPTEPGPGGTVLDPWYEGGNGPLIFSPDGRYLLNASWTGMERWDLEREVLTPLGPDQSIEPHPKRISPDGRLILYERNHDVKILDMATGKLLCKLARYGTMEGMVMDHSGALAPFCFSIDSRYIVGSCGRILGNYPHLPVIWNARSGEVVWSPLDPLPFAEKDREQMRVAYDGPNHDSSNTREGKERRSIIFDLVLFASKFRADGKPLVWDGLVGGVRAGFSPNGRTLFVQLRNELEYEVTVYVFDVKTCKLLREFSDQEAPSCNSRVRPCHFSRDGELFLGKRWFYETATCQQSVRRGQVGRNTSRLAVSPDGRYVFGIDRSVDALVLEDVEDRRTLRITQLEDLPDRVQFTPDEELFAVRTGERLSVHRIRPRPGELWCRATSRRGDLVFSPDGRWLTAGRRLYETATGRLVRDFAE